jgi:acetyl-CoA synthetase
MSNNFTSVLQEERVFPPHADFVAKARISSMADYKRLYDESIHSPETFWAREAGELSWQEKWSKVLDWQAPFAKWFVGAKVNVCENWAEEQSSHHLGR